MNTNLHSEFQIQPGRQGRFLNVLAGMILAILFSTPPAFAAIRYLDLNDTAPGFGTAGAVDITTTATWTLDATGVAAPAIFPAGDFMTIGNVASDFDGSVISINMSLANNLTANPGGLRINGTNVTVTLAGTANCRYNQTFSWTVTNGSTLIITDTGNNNGWNFNSRICTFAGGGTIQFNSSFCANGNALNTMNMPGGTLKLNQTLGSNFGASAAGAFTLTAGTLQFLSASALGRTFTNWNNSNVFTIGTGNPTIDNLSGADGTLLMGGSGRFTFGGDLTFTGSSSMSLGNAAVTLTGTRQVTVAANTLTIGGPISGTGFGLTKAGAGTLQLAGANTYTGNTTIISAGTLALAGAGSISNSPLTVSNAILDISGLTTPATTLPSLSISNSTLVVAESDPAATNILVTTLNVGGTTNIINFTELPLVTGYPTIFHVIKAGTVNGTLNFGLGTVPASPAFTLYLTNIAASGSVDLVVTGGPAPLRSLKWSGLNGATPDGTWDVAGTPTWLDASSAPTTYNQNDLVTFNDAATGETNINLTTALTPTSLTVSNNTRLYTLGGGGRISGDTGLLKQGSGTLILDESGGNDFSGAVTINGGTLQVGNNDGAGNLPPAGSVIDNGALVFKRNDTPTVANIISGTGTVTQAGSGTLILSGANTFTGGVSVVQGTLQVGNNSALGTTNGATTISSGATLEIVANAINLGQERITISGSGVGGLGALVNNSGSLTFVGPNAARVTLAGDTTVGGTGRFDLRSAATGDPNLASLICAGGLPHKLTKVGAGSFGFIGITVDPQLGDIEVQQGIFSTEAAMTGLGNVFSNLTVLPGGTFQMFAVTNQLNKVFTLGGDGTTLTVSATSGAGNTIIGPMNITNDCLFSVNTAAVALNLNNVITGPGKITKVGTGTLTISGNSPDYSGGLQVNAGNVTISGTLSNRLGANVDVGKFTLNGTLLGTGGLTNGGFATIAGSGTNLGPTDVFGVLNPGDTNVIGTLTLSRLVLEFGGTLNFDLGSTTTPGGTVNDLIVVNGDLTVNGNGVTINPLGLLKTGAGNPYRLFNYTGNLIWNSDLIVSGPNNYTYAVNTNTPGQVNIVVSGGPPVWNGGSATTSNWSDPANWGGVTINSGDSLFFNGPSRLNNINDSAPDSFYTDLNFISGASAFVLTGNPITLGGNVINNSSNPQTVGIGLNFGASRTFNGATGSLIIGGGVTNTATGTTLTLSGAGTLTNSLGCTDPTSMTNIISVTSNADWTLMNNPSSTPITMPVQLDVLAGTFNFGQGASAPNLSSTAVNNISRLGVTPNAPATFNMVNGTLTIASRLNTGAAANAIAFLNQSAGTINILSLLQGSDSSSFAATTFNITGGTFNVGTDIAPQNAFLASRGTGILTVATSGVFNCAVLDVSRNAAGNTAGSVGVVNLNAGGTLAVTRVGTATGAAQAGGVPTATVNFNGGTLKARASAANFYQGNASAPVLPITSIVKSGGAIIDTDTNAISILEPLQHDSSLGGTLDGGLTKTGTGTLTLTANNTYSGTTLVNDGTLLVNGTLTASAVTVAANGTLGGNGSINSNVTVNVGGTISPGTSVGVLTVTNNINLQGRTFMEVSKSANTNDRLRSVLGAITYGGTLSVTNLAGTFQGGESYKLFEATSYPGAFTTLELPPLGTGLSWNTNALSTTGTLSVSGTLTPLSFTGVTRSGTDLVFSGAGGTANGQYLVLGSTNVTLPRTNWTRLQTNQFDGSGNFSVTNAVDPNFPNQFYLLQLYP